MISAEDLEKISKIRLGAPFPEWGENYDIKYNNARPSNILRFNFRDKYENFTKNYKYIDNDELSRSFQLCNNTSAGSKINVHLCIYAVNTDCFIEGTVPTTADEANYDDIMPDYNLYYPFLQYIMEKQENEWCFPSFDYECVNIIEASLLGQTIVTPDLPTIVSPEHTSYPASNNGGNPEMKSSEMSPDSPTSPDSLDSPDTHPTSVSSSVSTSPATSVSGTINPPMSIATSMNNNNNNNNEKGYEDGNDDDRTPEQIHFENTCIQYALSLLSDENDIHSFNIDIASLYKGFVDINDKIYLFVDFTHVINKIKPEYSKVIIDELVYKKKVYNIPVSPSITELFDSHPKLKHLYNLQGNHEYPFPFQLYPCEKDDSGYKNVTGKLSYLPFEHEYIGRSHLFSTDPFENNENIIRCACFISKGMYIVKDVNTSELTDSDKEKHAEIIDDACSIYFHENGYQLWGIKNITHFVTL